MAKMSLKKFISDIKTKQEKAMRSPEIGDTKNQEEKKKIDKLTPEQEAMIPVFVKKYTEIAYSTEPIDMEKAKVAVGNLYELMGDPQPEEIILAKGPREAWEIVCNKYAEAYSVSEDELKEYKNHFMVPDCQGNLSSGYCAFADYLEYLGLELPEIYHKWKKIMDLHLVWPLANCAVLCERPYALHMDENNQLHCEDGPAYAYHDGTTIYAIHGEIKKKAEICGGPEKGENND